MRGEEIALPLLVRPAAKAIVKGLGGADGCGVCSGAALLLACNRREVQRRGSISRIQLYDGGGDLWGGTTMVALDQKVRKGRLLIS